MTASGEPVSLSANDIHLAFGANEVLRGVNIDVPAGTTAAVIGPSGSGKSTLLRTLNRLYEPDQGDILLDGRSVLKDNPDNLRQRIGMVFQHFNLFPHRTALENVIEAPIHVLKKPRKEAIEQGRALLEIGHAESFEPGNQTIDYRHRHPSPLQLHPSANHVPDTMAST